MSVLTLRRPVMVAAGCGGTGRELAPFVDLDGLAFVTRTLTREPRAAGRGPRVAESPSGLLLAAGLPNPGLASFLEHELPWLVRAGARVFVSLAASSLGELAELARSLGRAPGVAGVEVNLTAVAGPHQQVFDAREPFHAASAVGAVRRELPGDLPVLAKLRPDVARVTEAARAVADAGATAVVLGGALPAAMPDGRPAGLSGPAVRPVALRCVAEVGRALPDLTIVGAGGVASTADLDAFRAAGAHAVQLGTALLHDPLTLSRVLHDLEEHP